MVRHNDVLKLRVYGPVEKPQHEDDAPCLYPRYVPFKLGRCECAARKAHRPNSPVILALFQAAANAARTHAAVARKNKLAVELWVSQWSALRALERHANIQSFSLASRVPGIPKHRAILIHAAHLQTAAHGHCPLSVIT